MAEKRTFVGNGYSAGAVVDFIGRCRERNIFPRAFTVVKGGETAVRFCAAPYSFAEPMLVYSLSKSFNSVACGMCIDDGLLSPDTSVTELFSDKIPESFPEIARGLKLSDLLSMQSGQGCCAIPQMRFAPDSIAEFFRQPFVTKPGTTFVYSTAASCICAAAAERVSGKKLPDLLYQRMFSLMGEEKPRWFTLRDGQCAGGTGLYISCNALEKFGRMLLAGGVYEGKRIVSREYLELATSKHSVDVNNGAPDWTAGYGFQFWMNARGGFRGDGAYGQLLMVFPEEDTLVTFMGEVGDMAAEVGEVYRLLDELSGESGRGEELERLAQTMYLTKPVEAPAGELSVEFGENDIGLRSVSLYGEGLLHAVLGTDYGTRELVCGNGEYILNRVMLKYLNPTIITHDPMLGLEERISVYAAYERGEDGGYILTLRHADTPHVQRWHIDKNGMDISLLVGDVAQRHFPAKTQGIAAE